MKTIIVGSRECSSLDILKEAISQAEENGIVISEVVTGEEKGISTIAASWAKLQGINLVTFPVKWNDLTADDAVIKEKFNPWKKKKEHYNANAGKARDRKMISYADACISIDMNTGHSRFLLLSAKKEGLKTHEYQPQPIEDDLERIIF